MKKTVIIIAIIVLVQCSAMAKKNVAVSGPGSTHRVPSPPPVSYYHPRYYGGPDYLNHNYYHNSYGRNGHPNHSYYNSKRNHYGHPYYRFYYKEDYRSVTY